MDATVNITEINARLEALAAQRNEAMNNIAVMAGLLTVRNARIAELEKALAEKADPVV